MKFLGLFERVSVKTVVGWHFRPAERRKKIERALGGWTGKERPDRIEAAGAAAEFLLPSRRLPLPAYYDERSCPLDP